MPPEDDISLSLNLDYSDYERGITDVVRRADVAERALRDIAQAANRAEASLNDIDGNIAVAVNFDDSELRAAIGDVEGLDSARPTVAIAVSDQSLADVDQLISDIDAQRPVVTVDASYQSLLDADQLVDEIDAERANVTISGNTSDIDNDIEAIKAELDVLQGLAVVNIVLNLPANLQEISTTLQNLPVIGQVIELDNAVASLNARVINDIPNAGRIINDVYTQNWGETRQEIADVIVELDRMGIANEMLEDAATGAFQAATVGGEDLNAVIAAADQLVTNNLVSSYREAFDFIVRGYQEGFNQGGDFLDTITEYSPVLADNGLNAQSFFNILNQGLESGAFNADKLIDGFKEMLNLTREEISIFDFAGDETDRTRALQQLGLGDEASAYSAGEITGTQFADGVLDALRAIEDPAEQRRLALAIFSPTMVEDIGLPNLLAIDLEQSSDLEMAWQNSANEAADIYTATIGSAFSELSRTIEVELTESIATALNLDAWLEEARSKIQTLADEIQSGSSFGTALEVALEIPGLADQITRLESTLGNIAIAILEGISGLLELIGQGDAAELLRGGIADIAGGQFTFDLKLAETPDEIAQSVNTALERGVDPAIIASNIETAVEEAISTGNLEAARNILSASRELFSQSGGALREELLAGLESTPELKTRLLDVLGISDLSEATNAEIAEGLQSLQGEFVDNIFRIPTAAENAVFDQLDQFAAVTQLPEVNIYELREQVTAAVQAANDAFTEAINSGDFNLAGQIADQLGDPQLFLEAFQGALSAGEIGTAQEIALRSGDQTLIDEAERQAQLYRDSYEATLEAGQFGAAINIAEQLDDQELIERAEAAAEAAGESFAEIGTAAQDASDAVYDAVHGNSIVPDIQAIATAVNEYLPPLVPVFQSVSSEVEIMSDDFADAAGDVADASENFLVAQDRARALKVTLEGFGNALPVVQALVREMRALASAGTDARQAVQSVNNARTQTQPAQAMAAGGTGEGVIMTGERGPELVFSDSEVAVLNNQTTRSMFAALEALVTSGLVGGGGIQNSRNITVNQNIFTRSQAESDNAAQRTADAVRGF